MKKILLLFFCCLFSNFTAKAFYNQSTGRWLSRDPIGERGGENIYVFVLNRSTSVIDLLGEKPSDQCVVVTLPVNMDGTLASIETSVNANKKEKGWHVINVESLEDGNQQLKGTPCSCIKELNIIGHASSGSQGVGNGKARLKVEPDRSVSGLELFKGVKFCKPCTVYLRGCSAGEGENGMILLKAVANATGCTTKGWTDPTTELTPYGGLPGSGIFNFSPDVSVKPD